MGIIWTIGIGYAVGAVAKFVMPSFNQPSGFNLTTTLGVLRAVVASFIGPLLGWFSPGQGTGILAAAVGAIGALAGWDHAQNRASDVGYASIQPHRTCHKVHNMSGPISFGTWAGLLRVLITGCVVNSPPARSESSGATSISGVS